jgi:alkylation response protein AidB-like acyl-CoA dehydrogenase
LKDQENIMQTIADLDRTLVDLGPRFAHRIEQLDETDGFVADNYADLKARRIFSALVPLEFGGSGLAFGEIAEFIRKLAHHCSSTALAVAMHQHLVAAAVANHRAGRGGEGLLRLVARTEAVLVSTGANDWLDSNGTAKKVPGGYRINAVKPFASGSPAGDTFVTSVAFDSPDEGEQVLHFVVPARTEGVRPLADWRSMGMRATGSQTIRFDDVFIPSEAVSLKRARGPFHPVFATVLTVAMPLIVSAYVGTAEAACVIARKSARGRAADPVTPYLVGEMENLITTAQIIRADMIRIANDLDIAPTVEAASAMLVRKTIAANHVLASARKAMEVCGGAAFARKNVIERLVRDAHAVQFHPLPEKRQHSFTGRLSMGLSPVEATPLVQKRAAE